MSIETRHPEFVAREDDWRVMRDTFAGERTIKEAGSAYLPPTQGMIEDGATRTFTSAGFRAYQAYVTRAVFPDLVNEATNVLVGVMHREPAIIELPAALEPMRKNATRKNETLQALLRRINEQQMVFGRYGLLADIAQQATLPHLVGYNAEAIINWDNERFSEMERERLSFLVLNETTFVRGKTGQDIFDWMQEARFRVAFLEPVDREVEESELNPLVYKTFTEIDEMRSETVAPAIGGRVMNDIPWTFIGANDLFSEPDEVPLLGLANLALTIYRGEADYRQTAFMLGQDTFVIIGDDTADDDDEEGALRLGAGAVVRVPIGGDAKFEGINGEGMSEQRSMLQNDYTRAVSMGSRLLEPRGSQAESGEALRIRVAAQTSTLTQLALTGAAGLESILRQCAEWVGANPDEVKVTPNLDFTDTREEPSAPRELVAAKNEGFPISLRSLHEYAQRNDFTLMTWEEEEAELKKERAEAEARGENTAPDDGDGDEETGTPNSSQDED